MKKIQILPMELAQKIAAGEVVERPSSVIKELVENAIDAQACFIRVEIGDGGKKKISVTDDGHGIPSADIPLALERHATSKIQNLDDLWNIQTMGFRGEALPSIASVSRFTIESKTDEPEHEQNRGRRLYFEGLKRLQDIEINTKSPIHAQKSGTRIIVEDLFFNVPARLKFLRSKLSETSAIRDLLERVALCHPHIHFQLFVENKKTLDLPAVEKIENRIAKILNSDASSLELFASQFEQTSITGWFDRDSRAANSQQIFFSVNGRMVKDKLLHQAIVLGLRPQLMEGEYPKVFLSIQMPAEDVDVNVHPAKTEVRFRQSRDLFQLIHGALEKIAKKPAQTAYAAVLPQTQKLFQEEATIYKVKNDLNNTEFLAPTPAAATLDITPTQYATLLTSRVEQNVMPNTTPTTQFTNIGEQKKLPPTPVFSPGFSKLHYIGQLKNTYLLFQDETGLILIDQHAAHERIRYEKIKADFLATGLTPQPLLISIAVKCKPDALALALDFSETFKKLGFEFEVFGDQSLVLRSIPESLDSSRASELFENLLSQLSASDPESTESMHTDPTVLSPKIERILSTSACHSSVRAGQSLSPQEARALTQAMEITPSALNCPHGRPASIHLTFTQIENLFKR